MNTKGFGTNILVLESKNWDRWCAVMKSLFGAQDVLDLVTDGYEDLGENPTEAPENSSEGNQEERLQSFVLYSAECRFLAF
jgi:hypothetical protein